MAETRKLRPRSNPQDNPNLQIKVDKALADGGEIAVVNLLTEKQRRFVEEYVKNFEEVDAIYAAGFKPSNRDNASKMASNLLRHPAVIVALRYYSTLRAKKTTVDVPFVLAKITKTIEEMEKQAADPKAAGVLLRAAELLARHLGMFTEKIEHTGKDGGPIQHEEIRNAADEFASSIARLATRSGATASTEPTKH